MKKLIRRFLEWLAISKSETQHVWSGEDVSHQSKHPECRRALPHSHDDIK